MFIMSVQDKVVFINLLLFIILNSSYWKQFFTGLSQLLWYMFQKTPLAYVLSCVIFLSACAGSHFGSAAADEKRVMKISEKKDVINFMEIREQTVPSLVARGEKSRGIVTAATGSLISLATDAVKKMIAMIRKNIQPITSLD
jgi:hypothetical protein